MSNADFLKNAETLLEAVRTYAPLRKRYFAVSSGIHGGPWTIRATHNDEADADLSLTPLIAVHYPKTTEFKGLQVEFKVTHTRLERPIYYPPLTSLTMVDAQGEEPAEKSEAWYRRESIKSALNELLAVGRIMLKTIPPLLQGGANFDVGAVARLYAELPRCNSFQPIDGPYQFPLTAENKAEIVARDAELCVAAEAALFIIIARCKDSAIHLPQLERQTNAVFISYSHDDEAWLGKLITMIDPAVRSDVIEMWYDRKTAPGVDWHKEIRQGMERASIGVLLVSDNFLASAFIAKEEMPYLLEEAKKNQVTIIWVALSHCLYKQTPLEAIQAANNPATPLDSLSESDQKRELKIICEKIICAAVAAGEAKRLTGSK